MSHPSQQEFIRSLRDFYPAYFNRQRVLEVGSLNINGTVRDYFTDCDYTGIDLGPGPGVDTVAEGHTYAAADDSFMTVLSCECFEHNPYWAETFANMIRMTQPGGLIIMSCATVGRLEHGTRRTTPQDAPLIPWSDYYRNLEQQDFESVFNIRRLFRSHQWGINPEHHDLYFFGFKR